MDAEAALNRLVQPLDLLDPVFSGKRRKNRLVEPGQEQFHLPIADQPAELIQVRRIMGFQPFQKRAREMEYDGKEAVARQTLQDRAVHVANVLLKHVIEVADRLVKMKTEDKADR